MARNESDITEPAFPHELVQVPAERIEADVVTESGDHRGAFRQVDQRGGLGGGHGERLLADDVLARGQGEATLLEV